jgi:hypothetical protein
VARLAYALAMVGNRGLRVIATLVLSLVGVASCGGGAGDPVASDDRTAGVYESILDWLLDEEPGVSVDETPEWPLFVGSRSDLDVDLDVQVAVVEALEPRISVRFIDERPEAIDPNSDDVSVHDDGLLVGLGAVAEEGDSVEVYVDRYRNAVEIEAWLVTLRRAGTKWEIVGLPAPIDVRPLPADD